MDEYPDTQFDHQARVDYYTKMEQDGLNMVRYARKRLGWLAMGCEEPTESITQLLSEARDDSSI